MTGEIASLAKARKAAARAAKERDAVANRAKHGRTLTQRTRDAEAERRRQGLLDGLKRE